MITFTASMLDPNFKTWLKIDNVVQKHRPDRTKSSSYEAIFDWAPHYFEFSRMFRNDSSYIQYEFTEEEWIIFKLRWL